MIIELKMWTLESTQAKKFQRGKILKLACFVPMFHLVTLEVEPILTPGHHMNKLGRGPDATY